MMGIPSRVCRAWAWNASTMSAQASGVFGVGTEPPPDSSDPSRQVATSDGSPETAPRSAWVICPTFSSRVIRASSRPARVSGLRDRSIQGRWAADDPAAGPAAASVRAIRRQVPRAPRRMGRSTRRMTAPLVHALLPEQKGRNATIGTG
jgi:hypothetical protein